MWNVTTQKLVDSSTFQQLNKGQTQEFDTITQKTNKNVAFLYRIVKRCHIFHIIETSLNENLDVVS